MLVESVSLRDWIIVNILSENVKVDLQDVVIIAQKTTEGILFNDLNNAELRELTSELSYSYVSLKYKGEQDLGSFFRAFDYWRKK